MHRNMDRKSNDRSDMVCNYIPVCIDDYDDFCDLTKVSVTNINLITIVFLTVFALLNGVKSITNNMVVPMIADCTDYEYTISGHFVPGIMGALFSFIDKSFSALGTFLWEYHFHL